MQRMLFNPCFGNALETESVMPSPLPCIHWITRDHPGKLNTLAIPVGSSSDDIRNALLAQLKIHPADLTKFVSIERADGTVLPISAALPVNAGLEPYVVRVTTSSVQTPVVEKVQEASAKREDLEDVHAELEALKWQMRLIKKQYALGNAVPAVGGGLPTLPNIQPSGTGKSMTDEEAQEIIQDLEMLALELGFTRDIEIDTIVFRRFLYGIKDSFDKSPGAVSFRQAHYTVRMLFHVLGANSAPWKWRSLDKLVCMLSALVHGLKSPEKPAAPDQQGTSKATSAAQEQFNIIMSLLNKPETNFLIKTDAIDFKVFKDALKNSLAMNAAPRSFLPQIPPPRKTAGASGGEKKESVIPTFAAMDRFNASATTGKLKRRGSLDLGGSKKGTAFGDLIKPQGSGSVSSANNLPASGAGVADKPAAAQVNPVAAAGSVVEPVPAPMPAPREDKVLKERQLMRVYEQEGVDKELAILIRNDMLELKPNVRWADIAGQEEAKTLLAEALVLPALMPEFFKGIRRPWRGILMTGPPGTGKTMLAKAVATECNTTFFNVSASTLASKWRGESEKLVRTLFTMARIHAPSTIFIDEIDSVSSSRGGSNEHETSRRVKSELLIQMDGISSMTTKTIDGKEPVVMVLAATNLPWLLDEAMRRRLEKRIFIGLPDQFAREQLLRICLKDVPHNEVDLEEVAKQIDGFSGADVASLCRDAAMMKLREKVRNVKSSELHTISVDDLNAPIGMDDFAAAMKKVRSSLSGADIERYHQWLADYGSA
ncbi:P-loop containing nucleoside triphosphate hydrolase protein [Cladochytrium replicatum]|nr:P-loop containing nucleoside triphosphate hydrolase protein [Cladochytrium replicatum]